MSGCPESPYVIFGASGHGKVIADILERRGEKIAAFMDDDPQKAGSRYFAYPVWNGANAREEMDYSGYLFIVAIGDNAIRKIVSERLLRAGAAFGKAVHPAAAIGRDVDIGRGTVVMAHCAINPGTCVGEHCIINTSASIDHDNRIDDFVHLSPGARLGGGVAIGAGSWIGIGATVLNNLSVGSGALVGGGAVVIRDVEARTVVVGNPARFLRQIHREK